MSKPEVSVPAKALQYTGLPDVNDVTPFSEADEPLFRELRDVLKKYGALDRFGVVLLHTHFPVVEGELLLEQTDIRAREQRVAVCSAADFDPKKLIETSWRLYEDHAMSGYCDRMCYRSCRTHCSETSYSHDSRHTGAEHQSSHTPVRRT